MQGASSFQWWPSQCCCWRDWGLATWRLFSAASSASWPSPWASTTCECAPSLPLHPLPPFFCFCFCNMKRCQRTQTDMSDCIHILRDIQNDVHHSICTFLVKVIRGPQTSHFPKIGCVKLCENILGPLVITGSLISAVLGVVSPPALFHGLGDSGKGMRAPIVLHDCGS